MRNSGYADERSALATRKSVRRRLSPSSIQAIVFIIAAGILTGLQIARPNKRVIEAIVGFILLFTLWNASGFAALLFFVAAYPFPFALSIGNSDFVFILIIFIISLVRVRAGTFRLHASKALGIPVALMVMSYVLSFYNVNFSSPTFKSNLINTYSFVAAVLFFYLCISYIDSEQRMRRALNAMLISAFLVTLFTIFELLFPGRVLIPNWLYTQHEIRLMAKGFRMGGPFQDFELVAEFFALNVPLILLCLIRSRSLSSRSVYALLLFADLFMMFSTITRGAFITLAIGLAYMAIICRRDLNFVRLSLIAAALVAIMVAIDTFVARYTTSGSLFERLIATTFERGFIPENRYLTWTYGFEMGMEHPFIGHGPGWDFSSRGFETRWIPHNIYLYLFNTTGLFGLLSFLIFLYRLVKMSITSVRVSLISSPFPQALMKVLHVCLIMFMIDQIKIEYLRNNVYIYFIWLLFGLIAATHNIILKNERGRILSIPSP